MSKSKIACEFSIESLVGGAPSCFLWTFTVAEDKLDPRETARRWNKCQRKLVREAGVYGVRVFEMHPGGHGMHVHLVTSRRFDVRVIRGITTRHRFGRIHVKRIPSLAAGYVAKYLTKQTAQAFPELKGVRLWARVGTKLTGWKGSRVSDIVCDSEALDLFRAWRSLAGLEQLESFRFTRQLFQAARLVAAGLCFPEVRDYGPDGAAYHFTFIHPVTLQPLPCPPFMVL